MQLPSVKTRNLARSCHFLKQDEARCLALASSPHPFLASLVHTRWYPGPLRCVPLMIHPDEQKREVPWQLSSFRPLLSPLLSIPPFSEDSRGGLRLTFMPRATNQNSFWSTHCRKTPLPPGWGEPGSEMGAGGVLPSPSWEGWGKLGWSCVGFGVPRAAGLFLTSEVRPGEQQGPQRWPHTQPPASKT